jgi:hypothetical protein
VGRSALGATDILEDIGTEQLVDLSSGRHGNDAPDAFSLGRQDDAELIEAERRLQVVRQIR